MTKDEIITIAKQAGFERLGHDTHDYVCYPDEIVGFAKLIAEREREACALICDEHADDPVYCGEAIRARGQA
jgi:hypothetical protein